jgi:MFS family permease
LFQFIRLNARWLLGAFLLAMFSGFGQTFFISLFSEDIREHFELTNGQFGMLYMAATLCSAAIFLNLGVTVDRFSAASVAVAVLLALSVATMTMTFCESVWLLFLCLFGLRLFGQGMLLHVSQTAIGRWFDAERGRAISLTSMGLNFGESVFPSIVWAITLWVSWRFCWGLAATTALLAIPACHWLMKVPRTPKALKTKKNLKDSTAFRNWTRKEVIRDPLFWIASPAIFAPAFIATAIYFHHQHLVGLKAWPEGSFEPGFILLSIATVAAKFCAGPLIDRFGAIRLLWVYHIPLGLSCILLGFGQSVWFIYIAMTMIGIAMGFATSVFGTVWPELYGTKHLGAIRSIAVAGVVFSSACGSGVTGWLIDAELGFESQLILMAIWCAASTITLLYVSAKMLKRRETERK